MTRVHTKSVDPRGFALRTAIAALLLALPVTADAALGQAVPIRELVHMNSEIPTRLMGYGIVVGLDGTGDRSVAQLGGGQTVRSIANLLRQLDITIPPEALRTRNAAAVLVTAQISPYLRAGGHFEVHVGSLGDATSLRGGQLLMTPLVSTTEGPAVATALGALLLSDGGFGTGPPGVETSGRIPEGGLLEVEPTPPDFGTLDRLLLREPSLGLAQQIADAIGAAIGPGTATVEDPGSIRLTIAAADPAARAQALSQIESVTIIPQRVARVVIDGRDGTVVAGGTITVGEAVVSHDGITLAIDATPPAGAGQGELRLPAGASIQDVAAALFAVGANPSMLAAVFEALREVGAITAELVVR